MLSRKPKAILDRGASQDLWRNTLRHIPTLVGRLVYLSQLRNPNSGRYEHHGLAAVVGRSEAEKALRKSHISTFEEWLQFSLEQQKADLDLHFATMEETRREIVESWIQSESYLTLVPASIHGAERELFVSDMRALLEILKNVTGAVGPDREE